MNRRKLLTAVLATGGAVVSGLLAVPALLGIASPALERRKEERWRDLGDLTDFPAGTVAMAIVRVGRDDGAESLEEKGVYVWRRVDAEPVVFSRNCTDLSCPVNFDAGSECFFCPCHGGIFAKDGAPLAGPPSKPLYRYRNRIVQGRLEIDLSSLPLYT